MTGFGRAARRREARAAAKLPAERDGLRLVYQRGEGGDCLRGAIATVLGIDYEDTPPADGFLVGEARELWREWADARELVMRQNLTHAPAWLDLWIAVVVGGEHLHSMVMRGGRLLHNPLPGSPQQTVSRRDVLASVIVGSRPWVDAVSARRDELLRASSPAVWTLDTPHAAAWHRANGREAQAREMERRITDRQRKAVVVAL